MIFFLIIFHWASLDLMTLPDGPYLYKWPHTMDMLWEKFHWILPLYMKPINFQSKASVVCSVTTALFIDFFPEETKCVFPTYWYKNKWISGFHRKNHKELKRWFSFCVDYFLRYYLMMQNQPIVKRVNVAHEWAHMPYQVLSAPYHCCLYKHRRQDERLLGQSSWPLPIYILYASVNIWMCFQFAQF